MMMNIDETLELHTQFFQRVGSVEAAAMLTLAHRMGQQPAEKPAATGRYLNAEQAAEYLGCSVKSLYRQVELGRLVPLRGPKRSYRFTAAMLDKYLAA